MQKTEKQIAIRKAYGEYWDQVKNYIDQYGRLTYQQCWDIWDGDTDESNFYSNVLQDKTIDLQDDYEGYYQPKSLQGIDDNRGWIRVESEEDLPLLEDKSEFWIANENGIFDFIASSLQVQRKWENKTLTHYQMVVKPEKPIY